MDLIKVPLIGESTAEILKEHGIEDVEQLAALSVDNPISEKVSSFSLIVYYAKANIRKEIIIKKDIPSAFDTIESGNVYFFDAEYDSRYTETGPYGVFILGWMDTDGKTSQLFLEDPEDEFKILKDFSHWVKAETPVLIAYGSNSSDVLELGKCFSRYGMSFTHVKNSFFDLYANVIFTQNASKQKYFLQITKSGSKPLGLKNVSECLGYNPLDLKISSGKMAPYEYERYLREEHKKAKYKIKKELLRYNVDDLKRTKFIYDILKKKSL